MSDNKVTIGCVDVILIVFQVLFIVLKLGKIGAFAEWSWLAVFSPLLIAIGCFILFLVIVFIVAIVKTIKGRRK